MKNKVTMWTSVSVVSLVLVGLLLPPMQGYSASSFNFSDFSSTTGLQLNRDATGVNNALRLTPSLDWKTGTAWFTAKQPVANGFETTFTFQITDLAGINDFCVTGNTGGDGIAFVVHDADSGTSTVAEGGGGIGYHGIPKSIAVEFDTFCNQNDVGDTNDNHVSIHSQGQNPNNVGEFASIGDAQSVAVDMSNGQVHTAKIVYAPNTMKVFIDGQLVVSAPVNLATRLSLDDGKAYLGFTSSTGAARENHDIKSWSFSTTNTPPTANAGLDQTVNAEDRVTLSGSGEDPDEDPLTYSWAQIGGMPTVELSDPSSAVTSFVAPNVDQETDFTFELTVTDDKGATGKDQVAVMVTPQSDFSLTCASGISALKVGSSGSADCGIHSIGGFTNPVSMSCTTPPNSKLICSMQPTSVTPPANGDIGTKLSVTAPAASNTPIGDFTLQVTGTSSAAGGGTPITHTADVKVSVVCADPQVTDYRQTSSTWTLKASTLKQAKDVIDKRIAKGQYPGETTWDPTGTTIVSHDVQGNVACVHVIVKIDYNYPDWPNKDKVLKCQAESDEWTRYMNALTTHENGHHTLVAGGQFDRWSDPDAGFDRGPQQMIGVSDSVARQRFNDINAATQDLNKLYDTPPPDGTNHGVEQGAELHNVPCLRK
jgi:hypothetical protein